MPSVITMHSGISASIASITAAFVPVSGTKTTDTSAPVSAMVSATVPKTGTAAPFRSTVCPALRGLVPPTTFAPAASMRAPCLRPSEPVMPCTRIRLSAVRKIATSCSLRGGQLGRAARRAVHGVCLLDDRQRRVGQDLPALGRLVAVQAHDDRAVHRLAALLKQRDSGHDPEAVGHDLGGRAAADVEEVRRLDAAERLARVGHHVQRGHDQAGAVADDANLTLELDVVEVLLLGLHLKR